MKEWLKKKFGTARYYSFRDKGMQYLFYYACNQLRLANDSQYVAGGRYHCFSREGLDKVFEFLGFKERDFDYELVEKTYHDDYSVVFLEPKYFAINSDDTVSKSFEAVKVVNEYARQLGVKIDFSSPHRSAAPQVGEGILYLNVFSSPEGAADGYIPEVFGIALERSQSEAFPYSGIGYPIKDGKVVIGEVIDGNFYILFDLLHGGKNVTELLTGCLDAYVEYLAIPEEERKLYFAEKRREEMEAAREGYVQACGQRIGKVREQTEKDLQRTRTELEEASKQLTELVRREENLQLKSEQLAQSDEVLTDRFRAEYDNLLANPRVTFIKVTDSKISVFTDTIFLTYNGDVYELGDYRIDLHMNGEVRIINLRAKELTGDSTMHHPHVFYSEGSVCLGNISTGVAMLMGSYEYSVVTNLLIEFLQTVTEAHQYLTRLKYWQPVKNKKKGA